MMELSSDNAVVPEERLHGGRPAAQRALATESFQTEHEGETGPAPLTKENTWTERNGAPPPKNAPSAPRADEDAPVRASMARRKSSLRGALRRLTKIIAPGNDADPARRKSHYRRGSILIKHLEEKKATGKATEKDIKFFEMIKGQFDANIMESRTIISLSVFQTGSNPMDDPFAVIHMPVEIQQGFRRKLFAIFALQLLAVVVLVSFLTYVPAIAGPMYNAFHAQWQYVFVSFIVMVIALLWLYLVKYKFPINFVVLTIYTLTQSVFFAAFDFLFDTKATIFVSAFLFCVMSITTLICTVVAKRSLDEKTPAVLISYPMAILVSFFLSFVGSMIVYFCWMKDTVTSLQYSASLASMLLLVMWFAYDASCMNERLSPDEYMQGMVFFYTDMVLFLLFLSIIFVACFACEGDCACYGTADIAPIGTAGDDDQGDEEGDDGEDMENGQ
ncbi:TPA: hypothetical protein N0F65_010900 [Lagenidium giganteum]|uniref:Uncharacterized protein n=1 Tax=Lagenidium giganteum TaxID=4803 RepID=A0AAV2YI91_9STRA|nr:TPA: hypothetical protein N0F65_010900 [Lagenidium giganteum]